MSICVLLFWNVSGQKWVVNEDFSPNGGSTFGKQWFVLPPECSFDGSSFSKQTRITNANVEGQFTGSLRAGKNDVEPGSISIENATIQATNSCTLETDSVSKWPFLLCNGLSYPLIPVYEYRGARNG